MFLLPLMVVFFLNLLLVVAIFTYLERKILGVIQLREGPNRAGLFGLLQPIADALKLLGKEIIFPRLSNKFLLFLSPFLLLFAALLLWLFFPLANGPIISMEGALLFIFLYSAIGVYALFVAGWSTNSRYALLGSIRAISQMISYEIIILLSILPLVAHSSSLSLTNIAQSGSGLLLSFPSAAFFLLALFAETNRAPFDLPEAEAELVAGYNLDYSSFAFAFFFLGEYANMITMSIIFIFLFLSGFSGGFLLFLIKVIFLLFTLVWVRASWPRLRYDQLLTLCWKELFPLVVGWDLFYLAVVLW